MATRNIVPRATGEGNIGTNMKNWLAGYFVTLYGRLAGLGSARLDSNVTTTSTTAANITGLSFPIAANETVRFEANLNNGNSGTTGNKFAVNFPSGATLNCHSEGSTSGVTAMTQSKITAAATLTTEIYHTLATQVGRATIIGTIKNGSTAGTVQLQFAAVTSGTVTINAGSSLWWIRLSSATAY